MKHSKNVKLAKDFLRWLHHKENYEKWFEVNEGYSVGATKVWEEHPIVGQGRQAAPGLSPGHPEDADVRYEGPATAKATETYSKYLIVDRYAKAVQGMKAEDAVKWAEFELKKIYRG